MISLTSNLQELGSSAWKHTRTPRSKIDLEKGVLCWSKSKLRSRWDGPFVISNIFPHGVVELKDEATNNTFQVNGHQLKVFHEGSTPTVGEVESISLMEPTILDDTP
ncbi:hypothetical protein CR513_44078, partial [Mucuna pruriens]